MRIAIDSPLPEWLPSLRTMRVESDFFLGTAAAVVSVTASATNRQLSTTNLEKKGFHQFFFKSVQSGRSTDCWRVCLFFFAARRVTLFIFCGFFGVHPDDAAVRCNWRRWTCGGVVFIGDAVGRAHRRRPLAGGTFHRGCRAGHEDARASDQVHFRFHFFSCFPNVRQGNEKWTKANGRLRDRRNGTRRKQKETGQLSLALHSVRVVAVVIRAVVISLREQQKKTPVKHSKTR